jgi:ketosteroid isomerase-like protein
MGQKVADANDLPRSKVEDFSDFLAELDAGRPARQVQVTERDDRLAEVAELLRPIGEAFPRPATVLPPNLLRAVMTSVDGRPSLEARLDRRVPLDVGIELGQEGVQIVGIPRLDGALDGLHVLLRHRPGSGPLEAALTALVRREYWVPEPARLPFVRWLSWHAHRHDRDTNAEGEQHQDDDRCHEHGSRILGARQRDTERTMSEENVEIVRRLIEAWNSSEPGRVIDVLDPGVVFDATRRLVNPKTYTGVQGMRRMLADRDEVWEEFRMELDEVLDAGDRVVAVGRWVGKGRESGVEVQQPVAHVFTLDAGRVVRSELGFTDRAEALGAAGLRE